MTSRRAKTRCPRGFKFVIRHTQQWTTSSIVTRRVPKRTHRSIRLELEHHGEPIGYVDVIETKQGFWETHSHLDEKYRRRGLGTLMYVKAIEVILSMGAKIASSSTTSPDAQRVWLSRELNNAYVITYNKQQFRFHIESRRTAK